MSDHTDPLLSREDGEDADPPNDLERGLASSHGNDFRHLIDTQPEAVIKYVIHLPHLRYNFALLSANSRSTMSCVAQVSREQRHEKAGKF